MTMNNSFNEHGNNKGRKTPNDVVEESDESSSFSDEKVDELATNTRKQILKKMDTSMKETSKFMSDPKNVSIMQNSES